MAASSSPISGAQGRLCIVLAALLWSTSGALTKLLRENTPFGLNTPPVDANVIAAGRVFFAGAVLVPLLRRRDLTFRPMMLFTALSFAAMNVTFVTAMAQGKAASAILLQYTAPMWMYLISVFCLGEPADRRGAVSLVIGLTGIGLIVADGWQGGQLRVILLALASGLGYGLVLIGLRVLRDESSVWLTVVNHLFGALVLLPFLGGQPAPTWPQLAVLVLFGVLQMGVPYALVARGLRSVSPQEAGTLTLLEPLLNPLWAYLTSPETETLGGYTLAGGALILGALAYRYWPRPGEVQPSPEPQPQP